MLAFSNRTTPVVRLPLAPAQRKAPARLPLNSLARLASRSKSALKPATVLRRTAKPYPATATGGGDQAAVHVTRAKPTWPGDAADSLHASLAFSFFA